MNLQEYIPLAVRTEKQLPPPDRLVHACLGMITELGEITTELKRTAIYQKPMDENRRAHILEEIGDFMWYVAIAMDCLHLSEQNIVVTDISDAPVTESNFACAVAMSMALNVGSICLTTTKCNAEQQMTEQAIMDLLRDISMLIYGCGMLAMTFDAELGTILASNIAKLKLRYPEQYSNEAAEARADKGGEDARNS